MSTSSSDSARSASSRGDRRRAFDDGEIAHAAQQPPGDARRAARAPRDLARAVLAHADAEHARAALDDQLQFLGRVEIQPDRDAEAVAQRRRQQAGARRRADEREVGEVDLHRARRRALADDEIELEILHGGIEDFLHRRIEPVDLVDEQHVARLEIGELRREIAGLGDHRAGGRAEIDAEFARDDLRQRRLAEPRRADEQHMVERVAARLRGVDEDLEIGARRLLAREVGEREWAEETFPSRRRAVRGLRGAHGEWSIRCSNARARKTRVCRDVKSPAVAARVYVARRFRGTY